MIQTALLKWFLVIVVAIFAISFFLMKITDSVGEANFNKPHLILLPLRPSYKFFLNPYCKEMKVLKIFPDTVVVADATTVMYDDY